MLCYVLQSILHVEREIDMKAAFSVRMTPERAKKLRDIAHAERTSMNAILGKLIDSVPARQKVVESYDLSAARLEIGGAGVCGRK